MKYGFSVDSEYFEGTFDTVDEAIQEAIGSQLDPMPTMYVDVCECVYPDAERYVRALHVIEHIREQDEFGSDAAEGWPQCSNEQLDELTADLQAVVGAWLDRHKLRDCYYLAKNIRRFSVVNGEVVG